MRFSLLCVLFLLYSISAFPVQHRVNGISKVLSVDTAQAGPSKAPARVLKPASLFNDRASRIHSLPNKKIAKDHHSSCLKKRYNNSVEKAIRERTTMVGGGVTGTVYKTVFEGVDAVVKVINTINPGGSPESVRKEVTNLMIVGQFLGWGEKKTEGGHFLYVVMRNMGISAEEAGLNDQRQALNNEAITRYQNLYHIDNKDKNYNNYVYRRVNGRWRAEIIDWARATYTGKEAQPDPGRPRQISDPSDCNVM